MEHDVPTPISSTEYAECVGYLRYMADSTRPDLCFITSRLAAANRHPTQRHYEFLCKVTRYVKGTRTMGFLFKQSQQNSPVHLRIYAPPKRGEHKTTGTDPKIEISGDSDFLNDCKDRKLIAGTFITINNTPLLWFSRKQQAVAMITAVSIERWQWPYRTESC